MNNASVTGIDYRPRFVIGYGVISFVGSNPTLPAIFVPVAQLDRAAAF